MRRTPVSENATKTMCCHVADIFIRTVLKPSLWCWTGLNDRRMMLRRHFWCGVYWLTSSSTTGPDLKMNDKNLGVSCLWGPKTCLFSAPAHGPLDNHMTQVKIYWCWVNAPMQLTLMQQWRQLADTVSIDVNLLQVDTESANSSAKLSNHIALFHLPLLFEVHHSVKCTEKGLWLPHSHVEIPIPSHFFKFSHQNPVSFHEISRNL